MKIAIHSFSPVVRQKSNILKKELKKHSNILPWKNLENSDGCILYNIHGSVSNAIQEASRHKKSIISLQEGMFAIGWESTLSAMRKECERADKHNITQFVWSKFEYENYVKMGRNPELVKYFGNPEYDRLLNPPKFTRENYNIPADAFLILHIDQYAHPRGGPNKNEIELMCSQIENLTKINKDIWCIRSLHPIRSKGKSKEVKDKIIVRPFTYPIFDFIKMADLVITLSSTEGLTASILDKPIIQYDISSSKERWPFVEHGVAMRATSQPKLVELTKLAMEGKLNLNPKFNYKNIYKVDGKATKRVVENIINHFKR
jgi:UDP-N-acetylglucosamine 2-epimerase